MFYQAETGRPISLSREQITKFISNKDSGCSLKGVALIQPLVTCGNLSNTSSYFIQRSVIVCWCCGCGCGCGAYLMIIEPFSRRTFSGSVFRIISMNIAASLRLSARRKRYPCLGYLLRLLQGTTWSTSRQRRGRQSRKIGQLL